MALKKTKIPKIFLKYFSVIAFSFLSTNFVFAGPGDTIVVQTFTNGSPQDAWFNFPSDTIGFEKILMQYTLKCNSAQNPACGEWDYLTYSYLYKHTGLIDSSVVHQPTFLVIGNVYDTIGIVNSPTYNYTHSWQYNTVHDNTISLNTFASGSGTISSSLPFKTSEPVSRTQYLWKASELNASGMIAGDLTGLRFDFNAIGGYLNNLVIRFKTTMLDSLSEDSFSSAGFTEVYRKNTSFLSTGWNSLQFLTPFNWDGSSNIIIEIAYDNSISQTVNSVNSTDMAYPVGLSKSGDDRCITVHNGGYISVPMNDSLNTIDSAITVALWAYGNAQLQPQDGTCFEAVDSSGNRIINAHVPWSDNNVYWDAGNVGGSYDRINKAAAVSETKGQWNFWAFTKNVQTGSMKIYLNGNLWHSGTGLTRSMKKIKKLFIGKGTWSGSQSYEGRIDEFSVFNEELSQVAIQKMMHSSVSPADTFYNNLVLHYKFDDGNFITASDSAPGTNQAAVLVSIDNPLKRADDYISGFTITTTRPNVVFEQGVYVSHTDSIFVSDSTMNVPVQIISYTDSLNNPGAPVDTISAWVADFYKYIYNASGTIVDSVYINADSTIYLSYYNYYVKFPQVLRYELARYITPYGNSLSLGNGWTWTFDVSDYRTLLADSVHLAAGNWQELLNMKFLMIEGTPPRDEISIRNLWNGGFNYGLTSDPIENHLKPLKILIPWNAATVRWKSRITGHGMDTPENCAEFCPKSHYFFVNGTQQFSKLVWRSNCDLNPLYPQGGTWAYDRANWCPGAEVWTYDMEITPFVNPGDTAILDHDAEAYSNTSGWDYYQIEDQLVTYGAPNFTLDAAIDNVLSPTTDQMWGRLNPICTKPKIVIKNTGSTVLTSLKITYGITGGTPSVYNWTGNLKFMDTTMVQLDTFAWKHAASTFTISISDPNGGVDQYAYNNTRITPFTYVQVMPSKFVVECKTNNWPAENAYTLKDDEGNVILSHTGMAANTIYRDTLTLPDGCYEFRMTDSGEDGLVWWANTAQGSGYLRFKRSTTNTIIKNFNPDFGGEAYMQFTVGLTNDVNDLIFVSQPELKLYPNPTDDVVYIDIDLPSNESGVIEISDIVGKKIYSFPFEQKSAESYSVNLSDLDAGLYFVVLRTENNLLVKRLVRQ
jgi:hypothetical protein